MRISVYVAPVMALLLAACGPVLARWLAPRVAALALALAAVVTSVSALWALGLLAVSVLLGDRQPALSMLADRPPRPVAIAAIAVGALAVVRLVLAGRCYWRAVSLARAFADEHDGDDGRLVVVADPRPFAATLPGAQGRIVVSAAMLAGLGTSERRALLSHERSHLTHRHDLYRLVGETAYAINPLLGAVRASIAHALERWADEDAATAVGSRRTVARALAQAALTPPQAAAHALAFTAAGVSDRVHALYRRPVRTRRAAATLVLSLAVLAAAASADATIAIERLLQLVRLT